MNMSLCTLGVLADRGQELAFGSVTFLFVSLGLLAVSLLILWLVRSFETRLTLLGLAVAVAATGYGMMEAASPHAQTLSKVGLILVLAGIGCCLASHLCGMRPDEAKTPQVPGPEAPRHEP